MVKYLTILRKTSTENLELFIGDNKENKIYNISLNTQMLWLQVIINNLITQLSKND